jgi:hypothetical protein
VSDLAVCLSTLEGEDVFVGPSSIVMVRPYPRNPDWCTIVSKYDWYDEMTILGTPEQVANALWGETIKEE